MLPPLMLALIALHLTASALTIRDYDPSMIVFPDHGTIPRNVLLRVLRPDGARALRLEDDRGRRVPARVRPVTLGGDRTHAELRPARLLAANHRYCIVIPRDAWPPSCFVVSDTVDEAPPVGGQVTRARFGGGEVWLDLERGDDASGVALEIEVHRDAERCAELVPVYGAYLRFGTTLHLYAGLSFPAVGARCFEGLPDATRSATLRTRWADAAGNVGPWTYVGVLPPGPPANRVFTFGE